MNKKHLKKEEEEEESIPELGFGTDLVSCPEFHAVDLRMLIGFGRKSPSHHLVLMKLLQP